MCVPLPYSRGFFFLMYALVTYFGLSVLSAGVKGMHHHSRLKLVLIFTLEKYINEKEGERKESKTRARQG